MKKSIRVATMLVAGASLMAACNNGDAEGLKRTDSGLYYRFDKQNPDGQQVQEGDMLVGELTIRFDSVVTFSTNGKTGRLFRAYPNSDIKIGEGVMMLHVGDVATFAMDADTAAKYVNPMPPAYQAGKGQKIYYEINLQDIVTNDEYEEERANFNDAMEQRRDNEASEIAEYVRANNIKVAPTSEGLYVVVKKRGNGPKVAMGKQVAVNYTGRLLDGTIFDSSVESDARTGEVYNPQRDYSPLTYVVGRMGLIPGWEQALMNQPEGTVLQAIMPSSLAYGPKGTPDGRILPYSPLVFDLEVVSVR